MPQGNEGTEGQPSLPRHPDDVTPEWLTAALRSRGHDITVQSFRRSGVGEGIGMMSGLERLDVDYATGSGPPVIVLKMPARNDANRAVAEAFHLYEREVLFYRDVAPRSAARTPEVYYADLDGSDFVLLLEDLSDYRLGDQVQGCSLEDSRLGMVWLGKHHASFWDDVGDPSLDFMPDIWPSYSSDALQQGAAYGWEPMVEAFDDILPDHIRSLKERYLAAAPRIFEWMASAPLTVVHGDFRMDNLFFGNGGDQEPLIALDWQGCLRGRAAQDIGYFMSGSIPIELRRTHERELIGLWHRTLVESGVTGFSPEDAWENYRRGVLYVWIIAVVIAGTLDRTNERGHRWMAEMLKRTVATIDDLGLIELLGRVRGWIVLTRLTTT